MDNTECEQWLVDIREATERIATAIERESSLIYLRLSQLAYALERDGNDSTG